MLKRAMMKKPTKETVKNNAVVSKGNRKSSNVLQEGVPADISEKTKDGKNNKIVGTKIVGINKGITKNMDNYESLRIDVWCSDTLEDGETLKQGIQRLNEIVDEALNELVEEYI